MILDEIDKRELRKYTVFSSPREFLDTCYAHKCRTMYANDNPKFRFIVFSCESCDVNYAMKIGVNFQWDELTKSESKNIKTADGRWKMFLYERRNKRL